MELVKKMQQVGLSQREAEVYIALLQKSEFTAPELTKITTVTRTKIYEILQNLVHKGMCNENNKNGQKLYRAVKPNIILQSAISNLDLEIEQQKKDVVEKERKAAIERERKIAIEQKKVTALEQKRIVAISLKKELTSLYEDKQHNLDPLDYIEVLTDVAQIKERWLNIQKNTKKELLVFSKAPYTGNLEDNLKDEEKLIKNNVTDKAIYEYEHIISPEEKASFLNILKSFQKIGEKIRVTPKLPMKLVISDETIVMLSLNDRISLKPSLTTMIIEHPNFAIAHKAVFETYWMNAITIEEYKQMVFEKNY